MMVLRDATVNCFPFSDASLSLWPTLSSPGGSHHHLCNLCARASCVNDLVELHCFSRSGKHRFIILNLLNDKKLRVVQCG